jgi:hypothetical protein
VTRAGAIAARLLVAAALVAGAAGAAEASGASPSASASPTTTTTAKATARVRAKQPRRTFGARKGIGGELADEEVTLGETRVGHLKLGTQSAPAHDEEALEPAEARAAAAAELPAEPSAEAPAPSRRRSVRVAAARPRPQPWQALLEPHIPAAVPAIEGRLPRLSSRDPGLLFVLADRSRSMHQRFAGQQGITKENALADVVNRVLLDFVQRMNQGGVIRDRLDVMLAGYNDDAFPMFDGR